ncbi:ROK family transcriptional regulator [Streptomyces sp. NPDC002463]|uniref:ROK family transcriptional regulator n=1 Tax=Streptomyces sp. NPDC002463 TaxID=3364645 RepID=UPI0036968156
MADHALHAGRPGRPVSASLHTPTRLRSIERPKAGTQDNRIHNRALVLSVLYHEGAKSRADLVRATRLTAPTVSALVAELEADGLVADVGQLPDTGRRRGKPSTLVEIQDDAVTLVVLDLSGADHFNGALTNVRGEVGERVRLPIDGAVGADAEALVFRLTEELLRRASRPVLGIGVASPGIIDDAGVIRTAAHLQWRDWPLADQLAERFGLPAYVGNDMKLAALAVLHFGWTEAQNLMVVTVEHGVGAGLIVGGRLVEGEQFAAGEIGHITVDENGPPCVCGRRGCLDPMIDAAHLRRRLAATPPDRHDAVLAEAGRALGIVIAPIAGALNLNEIVLTGPAELLDGPFITAAVATARARTLSPISASLRIRHLADHAELNMLGATCLVLAAELGVL